jgi:hypothetical protein
MLLVAVTPRGLAGEETIVEITPMIGAGVGRIDGERLHGVDRLEACSTFGQPLIRPRKAAVMSTVRWAA